MNDLHDWIPMDDEDSVYADYAEKMLGADPHFQATLEARLLAQLHAKSEERKLRNTMTTTTLPNARTHVLERPYLQPRPTMRRFSWAMAAVIAFILIGGVIFAFATTDNSSNGSNNGGVTGSGSLAQQATPTAPPFPNATATPVQGQPFDPAIVATATLVLPPPNGTFRPTEVFNPNGQPFNNPEQQFMPAVIAVRDIPAFTVITPDMLTVAMYPMQVLQPSQAFFTSTEALLGKTICMPVRRLMPIETTHVVETSHNVSQRIPLESGEVAIALPSLNALDCRVQTGWPALLTIDLSNAEFESIPLEVIPSQADEIPLELGESEIIAIAVRPIEITRLPDGRIQVVIGTMPDLVRLIMWLVEEQIPFEISAVEDMPPTIEIIEGIEITEGEVNFNTDAPSPTPE